MWKPPRRRSDAFWWLCAVVITRSQTTLPRNHISYIKAYLSCDTFTNPDKFSAWIFKIGYNTFINHRRAERPTTGYEDAREITSQTGADSSFAYQELYEALDRIPAKERTSILLFYMEGYTIKEIAEIQDVTQDAVKQHLYRGRNHLRGLLSDEY